MMTHDIKDDPALQVPGQDGLMSSEYTFQEYRVLQRKNLIGFISQGIKKSNNWQKFNNVNSKFVSWIFRFFEN